MTKDIKTFFSRNHTFLQKLTNYFSTNHEFYKQSFLQFMRRSFDDDDVVARFNS